MFLRTSTRRSLARLALIGVALGVLGAPARAQSVSPPIAEYREKTRSSFTLTNPSLFPLTAVLEVQGFTITEDGDVIDQPLDTTRVRVKLSAMSFRIPPRGSYTVFYEATADTAPVWFNILSTLSGARTQNGLNLRVVLPHVVYLNQREPLQRGAVSVRAFFYDSAAHQVLVELENASDALGRVLDVTVRGAADQTAHGGAFPLLPRQRRRTRIPWSAAEPPVSATVRFAGFSVEVTSPVIVGAAAP